MARRQDDRLHGALTVEYRGTVPAELRDCLSCLDGAAVSESKTLIITTPDPGRLLDRISPYLRDAGMGVERITIRGGAS